MKNKRPSPYDSPVASKQKQLKNQTRQISPQFNQFYQQNATAPSKRPSLIHPSLISNQERTSNDQAFDRIILSTTKQEIFRQGGQQERDSRSKVKIYDRYPYNCYGKIKATYQNEIPKNHKPIVKNHKIIQNKQYLESYSYGIAAFIGQGLMVTAAHVIPDQIQGKKLVKTEVYFQYSKLRLQVEKVLLHPQYQYQRLNSVSPFDMAVLVMKPNSNFQYPKKFLSIQWDYNPRDYPGQELTFLTFFNKTQQDLILMQANHSEIEHRDQSMILYKKTTMQGDSGSLILLWKREQNEYKGVGLHIGNSGKANYGLLLTSKTHSPKDIFSQMIEHNLSLQQSQLRQNNSSSLKRSDRQNNKELSAIQIMGKLQANRNYFLSTEKYIKIILQENLKRKTQNQLLRSINAELKRKNVQMGNERISNLPKIQHLIQTRIQRNQPQRKRIQSNDQTQKNIQDKNIKQNKKRDNNITPKKESRQSKQVSIQDRLKKTKRNYQRQQQNCILAMCKVFSDWLFHRRKVIANEDQPSSSTLQN